MAENSNCVTTTLLEILHGEFRQNARTGMWNAWKNPFIASHISASIVNKYG
jgi:hypothetical protein